jgi:hypothetical protein
MTETPLKPSRRIGVSIASAIVLLLAAAPSAGAFGASLVRDIVPGSVSDVCCPSRNVSTQALRAWVSMPSRPRR